MSDYEQEIEYLDEDADIVQQCVQNITIETPKPAGKQKSRTTVEKRRTRSTKIKTKYDEEDSDYVPSNEKSDSDSTQILVRRNLKPRKAILQSNVNIVSKNRPSRNQVKPAKTTTKTDTKTQPKKPTYSTPSKSYQAWSEFLKMNIRIPDYEDPICLPVKHYKVHNFEKVQDPSNSTLCLWNQLCLEHLSTASAALKPHEGHTVKSQRTLTFKRETSKTGEVEMCVKGVTSVLNEAGEEISEMYKAPLPRFKEQRYFDFNFLDSRHQSTFMNRSKSTVQLTTEVHDEKESLVAYKAEEGTVCLYDTVENESDNEESLNRDPNDTSRRYLQETVRCRQCVSCYQHSHRQLRKDRQSLLIKCPICTRPAVSLYNLLKHLRTHLDKAVRAHARNVAHNISKILEYHYKCRLCSVKFLSIKKLRAHLNTHINNQSFNCDVCNKTIVVTQ